MNFRIWIIINFRTTRDRFHLEMSTLQTTSIMYPMKGNDAQRNRFPYFRDTPITDPPIPGSLSNDPTLIPKKVFFRSSTFRFHSVIPRIVSRLEHRSFGSHCGPKRPISMNRQLVSLRNKKV